MTTRQSTTSAPHVGSPRRDLFQDTLGELTSLSGVAGGLIIAKDGFIIAAQLIPGADARELAGLAAALGRELDLPDLADVEAPPVTTIAAASGRVLLTRTAFGFLVLFCLTTVDLDVVSRAMLTSARLMGGFAPASAGAVAAAAI